MEPGPGVPMRVWRGLRVAGTPFDYNHSCQAGHLLDLQWSDGRSPAGGTTFYYLVAPDGPCARSALGTASDGSPRPEGSPCVAAAVVARAVSGDIWDLRMTTTPEEVRIAFHLGARAAGIDLYAVSFDLLVDPARLELLPGAEPGDGRLFGIANELLRVETVPDPTRPGTWRITVARTGVGGSRAVRDPTGAAELLLTTRWRRLAPGRARVTIQRARVMDGSFQTRPLPDPAGDWVVALP